MINQIQERIRQAFASRRFRGAAAIFSARSFNSMVSLAFSLFAGRILAVEDHGLYTESYARIVIIQALAEVGLQFSLVRFLVPVIQEGAEAQINAIVAASLRIKFYAALILGTFFLMAFSSTVLAPTLSEAGAPAWLIYSFAPQELTLFWLIFVGGLGMSLLSYLESTLLAHESYLRLALWLPSVGLIRLTLLGIFVFRGSEAIRAEHVVYIFALGPYIAAASFFFFFPASFFFKSAPKSEWKPWIRKLLYFNVWILAASIMSILSDWMEIHLIGDNKANGLYGAARMPMQGFLILLATMQAVLLPRFSGLGTKEEFKAVFKRLYGYVIPGVILLLPGGFLLAWFILFWYGPEYQVSVTVFWLLYPNFLLRLCFAPLGTALFALDQPRLIAIEAGLRMSTGILFNLVLISFFGIIGAALASLLSQFAGWTFLVFIYLRFFRQGDFPFQRRLFQSTTDNK